MESATSRALCLPEIVSTILSYVHDDFIERGDHTIFACTLVASLWEIEANRSIWMSCGSSSGYSKLPYVRHLVAMPSDRRQKYADYIKFLDISTADTTGTDTGNRWEGRFHTILSPLSFPRLEQLELHSPKHDDTLKDDSLPLLQYLHSHLKTITIWTYQESLDLVATEEFLTQVARVCKGLKQLFVRSFPPDNSVSPEVFARLLQGIQSLTWLDWTHGMRGSMCGIAPSMSSDALRFLAYNPSLECLSLQVLQDSWIRDLRPETLPPHSIFQSLLTLHCELSTEGLEQLLPFWSGLRQLEITAQAGSIHAFSVIANASFERLNHLGVNPCLGTTILATDLLSLANKAPQLEDIAIPMFYDDDDATLPVCPDLDDAVLDRISASLPSLQNFHLLFDNPTGLTEKSLSSLGRNCPSLQYCSLSAAFDWKKLAEETPSESLSRLCRLKVAGPDDAEHEVHEDRDVHEIARGIKKIMPSLNHFDAWGDWALDSAMSRVLNPHIDWDGLHDEAANEDVATNEPIPDDTAQENEPSGDLAGD